MLSSQVRNKRLVTLTVSNVTGCELQFVTYQETVVSDVMCSHYMMCWHAVTLTLVLSGTGCVTWPRPCMLHSPHIIPVLLRKTFSRSVSLSRCVCLSLSACQCVCLSVCYCACLSVCHFVCLAVFLKVCLSVSLYLPVSVSVSLLLCLSLCVSLFVSVSVCYCACLSVCLYVCQCVCLSVTVSLYVSISICSSYSNELVVSTIGQL